MGTITAVQRSPGRRQADAAAKWLLDFAEVDLDRVSGLVHRELVDGLVQFMAGEEISQIHTGQDAWEYLRTVVRAPRRQAPFERFYTVERLRSLQAALRQGLGLLFEPASASVRTRWRNTLRATEHLIRNPDGSLVLVTETSGDMLAAFGSQVFRGLLAVSRRLRRCEDARCGRLFLATKRQRFCSPQHAVRIRVARKRAKDVEVFKSKRRTIYTTRERRARGLPATTRVGRPAPWPKS